jgi:hypothetical protein
MLADYTSRARIAIDKTTSTAGNWLDAMLKKVPVELRYALLLFVASRAMLTVIGVIAHEAFRNHYVGFFPDWLNIWGVWDSTWYINIAKGGYSTVLNEVGMPNYTFFPLYPLLMRLFSLLTGDYYLSGVLISNIALLVSCVYLYRLVKLDSDESTALRSIKYMFLFPTAFVLSGVLTESLFLALSLMSFYYAKKRNWLFAGVLGFFTALTRPYGVIILIPLAYEYLRSVDYDPRRIKVDALFLLLVPIGVSLYSVYTYSLTGDPLAFMHAQKEWGGAFRFPLEQLWNRLSEGRMDVRFNAYITLIALAVLVLFYKKVDFSSWLYGAFVILIPLSSSASAWSMSRYIVVAFPLFIIFARLAKNQRFDETATILLVMLQGLLMALWTTAFYYVV